MTRRPAFRRKSRTAARSSAASSARLQPTGAHPHAASARRWRRRARPASRRRSFYPVPVFGLTFQATPSDAPRRARTSTTTASPGARYARYTPNADTSLYAIYARGRRPEVLTALPPGTARRSAALRSCADAETVDSFEIGAKTAAAQPHASISTAPFSITNTTTSRPPSRSARCSSPAMPARPTATASKANCGTTASRGR